MYFKNVLSCTELLPDTLHTGQAFGHVPTVCLDALSKSRALFSIKFGNVRSKNKTQTDSKISYFLLVLFLLASCTRQPIAKEISSPWDQLPALLLNIQAPSFPDQSFSIFDYGAKGDNNTNCKEAFQKAIEDVHKKGGGTIKIPAGDYLVGGPIVLKSNIHLQLEEGATIKFSTRPKDYLPIVLSRWEGSELMNYSPLIYAYEAENIAITGKGVIDGQANNQNWWPWNGKEKYGWAEGMPTQKPDQELLRQMTNDGIQREERIFGEGHFLRPNLFQAIKCKNVWIKDVHFTNAPMWLVNPVLCTNVLAENVQLSGLGPNSDGIDPESCKNVLIQNCTFFTGDDCIAIKAGRDRDGREIGIPSENIIIRNCQLQSLRSVLAVGSEMSGGVQNIFIENCKVSSDDKSTRLLRIKSSPQRGGFVKNFYMRNIDATEASFLDGGIFLDMKYGNQKGNFLPQYSDFVIENVQINNAGGYAIKTRLLEDSPLQNLTLRNIRIDKAEGRPKFNNIENLVMEGVFVNGQEIASQ